jgi:hypothetical protein
MRKFFARISDNTPLPQVLTLHSHLSIPPPFSRKFANPPLDIPARCENSISMQIHSILRRSTLCALLLAIISPLGQAQEKSSQPLLDGKTLSGWVRADGSPVPAESGWKVVEGRILHRSAKAGDIFTEKEYGDFELSWDWKISAGGNSGIKYRMTTYGKALLGPEYQMLDDDKHPDGKIPTHRSGCIYDFFTAAPDRELKPAGEWNTSKIVAKGGKFEHWLNGKLVCSADTSTDAWKQALAKSKFKKQTNWALNPKGKIMLQDHGNEVWFKNLTIKEL